MLLAKSRSSQQSLLWSSLQSVVTRYLGIALTIANLALLARCFGGGTVGVYVFAFGIANTCAGLAGFGAPEGAARVAASARARNPNSIEDRDIVVCAHIFTVLVTIFAATLAFLSSLVLFPGRLSNAAIVWAVAWSINYSASLCLISAGRSALGSFALYTAGSLTLLATSSACALLRTPAGAVVAASAGSYLVLALITTINLLQAASIKPQRTTWKIIPELVRAGLPFATGRFLQSVCLWLPVWGAGLLITPFVGGQVGLVMRIIVATGAAVSAVRLVLRRAMADALAAKKPRRMAILLSAIGTASASLIALAIGLAAFGGQQSLAIVFGRSLAIPGIYLICGLIGPLIEAQWGSADDLLKLKGYGRFVVASQVAALSAQTVFVLLFGRMGAMCLISSYVIYTALLNLTLNIKLFCCSGIRLGPIFSRRAWRLVSRLRHS